MNIADIIEKKIENYFKTQIDLKNRINSIGNMLLAVNVSQDDIASIDLYNLNTLVKSVLLKDILNLNKIEKALTNEKKVMEILISGMKKNNTNYLEIKSDKTYFIADSKQIQINEIFQ